jgi:hypothetical protein
MFVSALLSYALAKEKADEEAEKAKKVRLPPSTHRHLTARHGQHSSGAPIPAFRPLFEKDRC